MRWVCRPTGRPPLLQVLAVWVRAQRALPGQSTGSCRRVGCGRRPDHRGVRGLGHCRGPGPGALPGNPYLGRTGCALVRVRWTEAVSRGRAGSRQRGRRSRRNRCGGRRVDLSVFALHAASPARGRRRLRTARHRPMQRGGGSPGSPRRTRRGRSGGRPLAAWCGRSTCSALRPTSARALLRSAVGGAAVAPVVVDPRSALRDTPVDHRVSRSPSTARTAGHPPQPRRRLPGPARYTLFHQGRPQLLDHMLVTRNLVAPATWPSYTVAPATGTHRVLVPIENTNTWGGAGPEPRGPAQHLLVAGRGPGTSSRL
jgi:hypothetical protein